MFSAIFYITLVLFIFVCLFMILLILIQKGRGGGLAGAFGGGGGNTAFGSKTGDVLTWATSIVFGVFLLLAVAMNLLANNKYDPTKNQTSTAIPAATAGADERPVVELVVRCQELPPKGRMIVSMTGFGDATAEHNGTHYAVEVRSLNNRYFKSVIKLPETISVLEPEVETLLREKLGRGSITYVLKMRTDSAEAAYHINTEALQAYLDQLQKIKGIERFVTIDLASLVQLPGVCQEPTDESQEIEKHGPAIRGLTAKAVEKLNVMRAREGQGLFEDLMRHIKLIASNLEQIAARAPAVVEEYHKRLSQRVNLLLSKVELRLNESDLIKEVAVFAERADISEEIQRLTSHLDAFEQSCRHGDHAGRKLDFISQEMLREANTIASKANDATIARHIVEIKGEIDRVKEQVQNVE